MNPDFRPMLAGSLAPGQLPKFPCVMSPKLDGVRVVVVDGVALSRNLKPIRNKRVQRRFGRPKFNGLDGELIVGSPTDPKCYRTTVSGVMSEDGEPDVVFHAFDDFSVADRSFKMRYEKLLRRIASIGEVDLALVRHVNAKDETELQHYEESWLADGYEGAMIRDYAGTYKYGRSSVREGKLVKLKRFLDAEATIVGFEEFMHNGNEAVRNKLGQLERSSTKAGKTGMSSLGALIARSKDGVEFKVGTGFTQTERVQLWKIRAGINGLAIKYKYFPTGSKERPRFPVFLGFRDDIDA